jgi:hypothetical protein
VAHPEKKFELFLFCNPCEQLLGHFDALVYTNRHNLPKKVAVKMSNIGLCYNLLDDESFDNSNFNGQYADGLLEIE